MSGLLEGAFGVDGGHPPVQREWLLGGLPFVRGCDAAQLGGDALDGLVRLDVARAFRSPTGWAVHFRFNAPS